MNIMHFWSDLGVVFCQIALFAETCRDLSVFLIVLVAQQF